MAEDKNLTQLIINEMTKAQYDALDKVNEDEIYILTDIDTTIHTDNSTLQGDGSAEKPIGLSDAIISTLNNKQDKLTAGTNISIEDNVISSTAQESFFRGKYADWANIPTEGSLYQKNYKGESVPSYNDYIVIEDASGYVPQLDKSFTINHNYSDMFITYTHNGITETINASGTQEEPTIFYLGDGSVKCVSQEEKANGIFIFYAERTVEVQLPDGTKQEYTTGQQILSIDRYSNSNITVWYALATDEYQGSWRFSYAGDWNVDNKKGWKPEYQIEEVMPIATETQAGINRTYTAGANIIIEDNVISSTARGSYFRGKWDDWSVVPTDYNAYPEDFNGNRTPTENDYIAVVDASGYRSLTDETIKISVNTSWGCTINDGTPVNLAEVRDWAKQYVWYLPSGTEIYGIIEQINSQWKVALKFNKTVVINGVVYDVGDIFHIYNDTKTATVVLPEVYEGAWRFGYHGTWNTDGVNGWKPEYQIEDVLPIADDTQTGIAKLYTTSGTNTDGAMTQKAVGDAISAHNTATDAHNNIRGVAGGLATLDNNAKVPISQINDALIGNVSYQGLWDAATNTPFLADPTGGLPAGYKALGYINFTSNTFIDTGIFISETDETVEYDIKMTPSNTGCFPFGAAGSNANENNTGSVYFYGSTLEYFAGSTRNIRLGEVVKDKDYIINIKLDQTTQTITIIENDLRTTQSYGGSIISPVSIILGGLRYGTANNPTHGFGYSGKIHYFVIRKNGIMVKQYQPAQRISDGAYGFYEHVSGEFVVSSGALFASGGGEIEIPKGYYYITTVAGDRFGLHFDVGDWIISAGGYWSKVDNTDAVVSVNGRTGNVVITTEDLDLSNYVQNTDIATYNKAGLLLGTGNGFRANVRGLPQCDSLTTISYPSANNSFFISKGTIENLKDDIVKRAITANSITLTDSEKEKARNWIGASAPTAFEVMPDVDASAGEIYQYVGETTEELTSGYFYKSVLQGVSYITSDPNVTFDFDLFWSELESAGITLETLQMIEEDKEHGGFTIIGTAESETNYRVQEINGVQVYALLTQSVQVTSSYVGMTNRWYYKPTEIFAWERVDVQPASEGDLTKEEADATYLQLTGGEMTGRIAFNTPPVPNANVPIIAFPKNSSVNLFIANSASGVPNNLGVNGNFVVTDNISTNSLGDSSKKVEIAYIKTLNNGADLVLPTEGGTLARTEDIQGVNTNINNHINNTSNPHSVTKAQVGLGNVDNTSDADKPISTATQNALNLKADKSDTYTKSEVDAKVSSVYRFMGSVATVDALPVDATIGDTYNVESDGSNYAWDGKAWDKLSETVDLTPYLTKEEASTTYAIKDTETILNNHIGNKTNPHEVTASQVGLGNVDNTADIDKPISTAVQTALDKKANITDIIKDVQNISSTNIYNSIDDLPELDASKNGTRYLALTNGSLPLVIYSWTYNTKTWDKIDQCRGSTAYINIETGKVYYYRSSAPHLRQFVSASEWGSITGTLSNQTDLNTALESKADKSTTYTKSEVDSAIKTVDDKVKKNTEDIATLNTNKANASDLSSHTSNTSNPHSVTKAQVGLENVDNTSDIDKPISTATQTALDLKADKSTTYTKSQTDAAIKVVSDKVTTNTASITSLNQSVEALQGSKADATDLSSHTSNVSNPHNVTAEQVGLGNVDNTSDTDKPISTATQTALNAKADKNNTYTKAEVDAKVSSVYRFIGSVASVDKLPTTATVGDTYNVEDTGSNYAWTGSAWDKLSETIDLTPYLTKSEASTTYETIENVGLHTNNKNNPHGVTKAQVGLGNVDNTSDLAKPISTATQNALNDKADKSTTYTKTEVDEKIKAVDDKAEKNSEDIVAQGNLITNLENNKASASDLTAHTTNTSNPHNVTAAQVGLGNVNNTSDADKPVSTATKNALDLKADKSEIPTKVSQLNNDSGYITSSNIGNGTVTIKQNNVEIGTFTLNQTEDTTIELANSVGLTATYDSTNNRITFA